MYGGMFFSIFGSSFFDLFRGLGVVFSFLFLGIGD